MVRSVAEPGDRYRSQRSQARASRRSESQSRVVHAQHRACVAANDPARSGIVCSQLTNMLPLHSRTLPAATMPANTGSRRLPCFCSQTERLKAKLSRTSEPCHRSSAAIQPRLHVLVSGQVSLVQLRRRSGLTASPIPVKQCDPAMKTIILSVAVFAFLLFNAAPSNLITLQLKQRPRPSTHSSSRMRVRMRTLRAGRQVETACVGGSLGRVPSG